MKTLRVAGMIIGIIAMGLGWVWFGWKLSLVVFIAILGNNFEIYRPKQ